MNGGDGVGGRAVASEDKDEDTEVDRIGFRGCAKTCAMARLEASAGRIPRSNSDHCRSLFFVLLLLVSATLDGE